MAAAVGNVGDWASATTQDGRTYFYDTKTNQTQWHAPEHLSPRQLIFIRQPWREYHTPEGKPYWHNPSKKASVWEMPAEFKAAVDEAEQLPPDRPPAAAPPAQTFVASSTNHIRRPRDDDRHDGVRQPFVAPVMANEPEYRTLEEAQDAYNKLLKRVGVQPDWTWEQTLKATVKDPQYRAIKEPKERKAAFEKYVRNAREQNRERERERQTKFREDFLAMLATHPEITPVTRWKHARSIIEGETVFKMSGDEEEKKQLYEEYIHVLSHKYLEDRAALRKEAVDDLHTLFNMLNIDVTTRWADAKASILSSDRFKSDPKFKTLQLIDLLKEFESYIKFLDTQANDARQMRKKEKRHRERHNREAFELWMDELKRDGHITAETTFSEIYPRLVGDSRFTNLLGQSGSTPLDFFHDKVEEHEQELRVLRNKVLDVLDDNRFELTPEVTIDDIRPIISRDPRTANLSDAEINIIFSRVQEKMQRRVESAAQALERQQRRAIDALRSRIKRLEPPVRIDDKWEDVAPRLQRYPEWADIDDEGRRAALDKHQRRMRDREEETHARSRGQNSSSAGAPDDRDGYYAGRRRIRYSRSPEADAYEEDRKAAQANRERQYRKASFGLSPSSPSRDSPRRGDRDPRDRRSGGNKEPGSGSGSGSGTGRLSGYDQERLERERERERSYRIRTDGSASGSNGVLDYGESGAGSMADGSANPRKRRDSSAVSGDSKRLKRESAGASASTSASTAAAAAEAEKREEEALKSGSEEGEIEEG